MEVSEKKELLLPEREYTSLELAYIFRHEIQHLKYHDLYLKLMYLLLCAVYWFQPAVWLMKREFARDLEAVCDRRTIRGFSASERYSYTQTMIQCMTQKKELRFPVSSGFGGTVKIMKERVRLIMKGNKMRKGFGIYAALAVLMCTGMLLVSCGSKAGKESQESSKELPALNENVSADTKQTEPIGIKEQDAPVKNTEEISEREATGSMQEENLNISADSENAAVEVPEQINLQNEEAQQIAEAEVPFASQSTAEENVEIASGSRNEETEIPLAEATDDSSAELPEQKNK